MGHKLTDLPVVSVQASRPVGRVQGYIIDPRQLLIIALYVSRGKLDDNLILHTTDIREFNNQGILIDHDDQLMDRDGLVRLQTVIDFNFELMGMPVETDDQRKLGKVVGFAFDGASWNVMRLYVGQSLVKSVQTSELIVHRQQIVKITQDKIVVDSNKIKVKEGFSLRRLLFGSKPALNPDTMILGDD